MLYHQRYIILHLFYCWGHPVVFLILVVFSNIWLLRQLKSNYKVKDLTSSFPASAVSISVVFYKTSTPDIFLRYDSHSGFHLLLQNLRMPSRTFNKILQTEAKSIIWQCQDSEIDSLLNLEFTLKIHLLLGRQVTDS